MDPIEITIFNRAVEYSKAGQQELANKDFRLLLDQYPRSIQVLVWAARTEKHFKTSEELLIKAREIDPENPQVKQEWEKLQAKVAPPARTTQAGAGPSTATDRLVTKMIFDRAVLNARDGHNQEANTDFRRLLDSNPNDVEVLIWTSRTEENITNARYFLEFAGLVDPKHPALKQAWKEFKKREKAAK